MKTSILLNMVLVTVLALSFFSIHTVANTSSYETTDAGPEYDPWRDLNDDGIINIYDVVMVTGIYGSTGTPINKTELLLELEARIDVLNATVISLKECVVVTGDIPYDGNGAYDAINGLSQDVSGLIPTGFTLVAAVATGYKAHQMTGARQDEPPLILEPKVFGTVFQTRVWDATGDEYGGSNWASMKAHIDYTLFITK